MMRWHLLTFGVSHQQRDKIQFDAKQQPNLCTHFYCTKIWNSLLMIHGFLSEYKKRFLPNFFIEFRLKKILRLLAGEEKHFIVSWLRNTKPLTAVVITKRKELKARWTWNGVEFGGRIWNDAAKRCLEINKNLLPLTAQTILCSLGGPSDVVSINCIATKRQFNGNLNDLCFVFACVRVFSLRSVSLLTAIFQACQFNENRAREKSITSLNE